MGDWLNFLENELKPKVEGSRAKYSWQQDGRDHGTICPASVFAGSNYMECSEYAGLHDFLVLNGFKTVGTMAGMPRFAPGSGEVPKAVVSGVL